MKRSLLFYFLLLSVYTLKAQDASSNNLINTLKDRISLSGYAQVGYTYDDAQEADNTFEVKRAILMTRGNITDKWSAYFMYSFARTGKILEAYTEYHFLPQLTARIGQFKTRYTIENQISPCFAELINGSSQAVRYLAGVNGSDPLYGATTGRDMGLLIYGELFNNLMDYNFAVMNGQGINLNDKNSQKDIVGSLMVNPLKCLSVGASFIKGKGCAIAASATNPGIAPGESYTRNRWSAGAVIRTKPVNIRTEYLAGKDGEIKSEGYYATLSAHVLPKFDIIASYDFFNKNQNLPDEQTNYAAGIQYWFYPKCRLQAQYTYCNRDKGENSNLLQAQLQVRF